MEPTKEQIDTGAQVLRIRQQAGRLTRLWADLPKADKRKWLDHAEAVLRAALAGL